MARQYYDVVVTGRGLGSLVTAALLARRSFRVLVVCGDASRPTYAYDDYPLARRSFTLLFQHSPVWQRVLAELAQSQTWRRRVEPLAPMFQALLPNVRMDVPADLDDLSREIGRFYPDVRRDVEELYASLAQVNRTGDQIFAGDFVFPPGSFWERRDVAKVLRKHPIAYSVAGALARDPEGEAKNLSSAHPFGKIITLTMAFGRHLAQAGASFADTRLHGAWTRGPYEAVGGEDALFEFLTDRVRAHGGDVWEDHAVTGVETQRGKVASLEIDGEPEAVGTQFLVSDRSAREVVQLAKRMALSPKRYETLPEFEPALFRFVTSVWAKSDHVPSLLARNAFLEGETPLHVQCTRDEQAYETRLTVEALIREPERVHVRGDVLARLKREFPFLGRGLLVVDSPHDGLPLADHRSGAKRDVERTLLRPFGGRSEVEAMEPQWIVRFANDRGPTLPELSGDSVRTPVGNVLLAGRTVLPALGQEGELLAAWSAARIVTKSDKQKERMRREMWRKVELG